MIVRAALKGCATGITTAALKRRATGITTAGVSSPAAKRLAIAVVVVIAVVQAFRPAFAQEARPSFSEWLAGVRSEAISRGVKAEIVDEALAGVEEPLPVILERDRAQAETVLSLEQYIARRLTRKLIVSGREAYTNHRALLDEVGSAYYVPPQIIAAIWGIESNYGRFSGVRPTVAALATLAWDPRRATFFRGELFNALEILNRGDIDLPHLKGSWAGAMGQVQFMPSSYLRYAEDYDGDGHRDIWSTPEDIFASIANYLSGRGWDHDAPWGREVAIPADAGSRIRKDVAMRTGSCQATRNMTVPLTTPEWNEIGVRLLNGKRLPKSDVPLSLVSGSKRHFLVTPNYDAILEYNCSHAYAIAVGLLGDAIASSGKITAAPAHTPKAKPARHKKG